ncbi:hypothetical protein U716_10750 [Rhodobacter capsulatus B6]|nr:hypothetical protein U716_10750 [Rhodobacter capsulatus B6]
MQLGQPILELRRNSAQVGQFHRDFGIEPPATDDGRIDIVGVVGGSENDHAGRFGKSGQFGQQPVDDPAQVAIIVVVATATGKRVDFVDK